MKLKLIILKNQTEDDHLDWQRACEKYKEYIEYEIIDLTDHNWLDILMNTQFDCILTKAPGNNSLFKNLYDERLYIISKILHYPIYPSYDENVIYENKKMLSYWLQAKKIKHPQTRVFYDQIEAADFVDNTKYPIVAKTNIGASGSGVKILKSSSHARGYIKKAFQGKGIKRRWGPNLRKKNYLKRIQQKLKEPLRSMNFYSNRYRSSKIDIQKHFVIFQEFIEIESEWRCVIIGDSYFGHKKKKQGKLISGGGGIIWDYPNNKILDFLMEVKEKGNLSATSIDLFETVNGDIYVNEIQCFFGFIDPDNQMYINGKPGRFKSVNGSWVFEEGIFNKNNSYDLRIEHVLELFENKS